ncbi:YlxR family protein [Nocardioides sp.]|uniref:YlxR family protein n=1 Tax=Nocardioides sp. TaxID=35761 RepID=UPI0035693369
MGCRRRAATRELLRLTAGPDAQGQLAVLPDPRGIATGRGAHLHPTTECYELAERRRAFSRALRVPGGGGSGLTSAPLAAYLSSLASQP